MDINIFHVKLCAGFCLAIGSGGAGCFEHRHYFFLIFIVLNKRNRNMLFIHFYQYSRTQMFLCKMKICSLSLLKFEVRNESLNFARNKEHV
jgi:hypothetical protein